MKHGYYVISPEAEHKLQRALLIKKIHKAVETDGFDWGTHHMFTFDLPGYHKDVGQRGYFKHCPKELHKPFMQQLQNFVNDVEKQKWILTKSGQTIEEKAEPEHFLLLNGYFASLVLSPEEFWDYKKFGFENTTDLFGTLGAYMQNLHSDSNFVSNAHKGHTWDSGFKGKKFTSEVGGSHHGDLRIDRTDMTFYDTIDPFGNKVSYRPIFRDDMHFVSGYHSTECPLLATLIKYADQLEIPSKLLDYKNKKFLKEVKTWEGIINGGCADAGDDFSGPKNYFSEYALPFSRVDEKGNFERRTIFDGVFTEMRGYYLILADPEKNLVFYYESDKGDTEKTPGFVLPSAELDDLIMGLFVQASKGLGRTSLKQLTDMLEYRCSAGFEKDMDEHRKFLEQIRKK
jgi:hypothetical protein